MNLDDLVAAQITHAANFVFGRWLNVPAGLGAFDVDTADWWQAHFQRAGKHHLQLSGRLRESLVNGRERIDAVNVSLDSIQRAPTLTAPAHLYRAAWPGFEDRFSWFDDFEMAKLIADDRGGGLRLWTCDVAEVFGSITFDRTESGGFRHQWTEWIIKPKNVREINRWRDPYAEPKNPENWAKRGVHAIEAAALVGSWYRHTDSKLAPMDREHGDYWLIQFQQIGQFEAFSHLDAADPATRAKLDVNPVADLSAPKVLYRGAPEHLKNRWSWTEEPETAQAFVKMFCPDGGKIWTAEADTVLGVIRATIDNPEPPFTLPYFTEWLLIPKEDTIREWKPAD